MQITVKPEEQRISDQLPRSDRRNPKSRTDYDLFPKVGTSTNAWPGRINSAHLRAPSEPPLVNGEPE